MKRSMKKLLGLLLVLVLALSLIPAAAAEESSELWVGGVQVTGETTSGEGWSFDADTKTLTLTDADITEKYNGCSIYADNMDLTVELVGKNSLSYALFVDNGNLKLQGKGSLSATDGAYGIYVAGSLSISGGCTVEATGGTGLNVGGNLSISGGCTVEATGGNYGLSVGGSLSISDGCTLKATGGKYGIYAKGSLAIEDSSVEVTSQGYYGCYSVGKLSITGNSKLNVQAKDCALYSGSEISLGEGLIIKEPAGGVVDGLYISVDGAAAAKVVIEPAPTHSITLSAEPAEGGTPTASASSAWEGKEITLSPGTNDGYTFKEWKVVKGGVTVADDKFTMGTEDVEIQAIYEHLLYTVTFDPNGGTGAMNTLTVKYGEQLTLPECGFTAPKGQEFDAWDLGKPGDKIDVNGDMTVKAQWKDITYTVKYDPNGGEGTMDDASVKYGEKLTLPECGFTAPTGKEFDKWDLGKPGDKVDVNGDMTVTAQWKDITYTVKYDPNGGKGTMDDASVTYGKKLTLPECGFTAPEGKEFDKWDLGKPGDKIDVSGDVTVKAQWKWLNFTVKFEVNGGSTVAEQTVQYGEKAAKPADPKRETYTFDGWYSDKELTKAYDFSAPVKGELTLYAKWNPVIYTVSFEVNGGSTVAEQKIQEGQKAVKPTDPKKENYLLEGWYSDKGLTKAYDFSTPVKGDLTLYAKWKEDIKYTVTKGNNTVITKGDKAALELTVTRNLNDAGCFAHFLSVQVDGKELVKDTDYTAKSGSTVITFKKDALNKLTTGTHTVTVIFDDGYATARITVKAGTSGGGTGPKTGDESTAWMWIMLIAAAVTLAIVVFLLLRSMRKNAKPQEIPAEEIGGEEIPPEAPDRNYQDPKA